MYRPNIQAYKKAKQLLGEKITIKNTLNLEYLKCPIGDDEFVCKYLKKKLSELKKTTLILSKMPFLHEAWTLLKYWLKCKNKSPAEGNSSKPDHVVQ